MRNLKLWLPAMLLIAGSAMAEDTDVVQKLAHGQVNWTNKMVVATGSGAATGQEKSVAIARLKAERTAKIDALRNILETIQGIHVTGKKSAGDLMSSGEVRTTVQGLAQNYKILETKYYNDGSVDVIVEMPLNEQLTSALYSEVAPQKVRTLPKTGQKKFSGLIVNATGLGALPAMAPRIVDEKGNEIYGASVVAKTGIRDGGLAAYDKTVESARQQKLVGSSPLVVKAMRLAKKSKTDLVISSADAAKLSKGINLGFLSEAKVVVVVD